MRIAFLAVILSLIQCVFTETTENHEIERRQLDAAAEAAKVADMAIKACYKAFVANVPPSFCYKKGADFGVIPTECSSGYFRSLALCYQNCKSGYYFVAGVCWQHCESGFADHGLTCFKHLFNWHFKKSYMSSSYTNFDSRVACKPGMYKFGALCYRDCAKIGLNNCGIGACAVSTTTCLTTIATMVFDFVMSLAKTITLIVSFGSASAFEGELFSGVSAVLRTGFTKIGPAIVKGAANVAKSVITKMGTKAFVEKMTEFAMKGIAKYAIKSLVKGTVANVCENVANKMMGKMDGNGGFTLNLQSFDITGLSKNCVNLGSDNQNTMCAKSILQTMDFVDPTGIIGMAASVMQPVCEV